MNKQIVTDIIKKAKVLATHEEYKKIWIRENMTRDDRVTLQKKLEEVKNKNEQRTEEEKKNYLEGERSPSKANILSEPKCRSRQTLTLQPNLIPKDYIEIVYTDIDG